MVKKLFKKVAVFATVAAMVMPTTAVYAADAGSLSADNTVEEGVFSVTVPSTLAFAIDPMELGDTDWSRNQIYSGDITMINKSNFPLELQAVTKVTVADDVTLQTASADVTTTGKNLYIVADMPKTATVTESSETGITVTPEYAEYAAAVTEGSATPAVTYEDDVNVPLTAKGVKIKFALQASKYDDATGEYASLATTAKDCVAVMKLAGTVNDKVEWEDGDIKVDIVFKAFGMSNAAYTETVAAAKTASTDGPMDLALNYIGEDDVVVPTIANTAVAVASGADVVATFTNAAGSEATKVAKVELEYQSTWYELPTTDYTVDTATANTIKLTIAKTADYYAFYTLEDTVGKAVKTRVTFDDGTVIVLDVTVAKPAS